MRSTGKGRARGATYIYRTKGRGSDIQDQLHPMYRVSQNELEKGEKQSLAAHEMNSSCHIYLFTDPTYAQHRDYDGGVLSTRRPALETKFLEFVFPFPSRAFTYIRTSIPPAQPSKDLPNKRNLKKS